MSDYLYIGVASDDRRTPVVAESLEECCEQVVEAFDLRVSARSPGEWEKQYGPAESRVEGKQAWRLTVRSQWWDYASIHRLDAE